jgi:hypothetical protein
MDNSANCQNVMGQAASLAALGHIECGGARACALEPVGDCASS